MIFRYDDLLRIFHQLEQPDGERLLYSSELTSILEKRDPGTVPLLISLLSSQNTNVRHEAVRGLWIIKDERAVDPLINILANDESIQLRRMAVRALAAIGAKGIVPVLLSSISHDQALRESWESFEALRHFDMPEVLDFYIDAVGHKKPQVREWAVSALAESNNSRVIDILIDVLRDRREIDPHNYEQIIRRDAAIGLGKWRSDKRVLPLLLDVLVNDPAPGARMGAIIGLGELGDTIAAEYLHNAQTDKERLLCEWAAVSLGKLGDNKGQNILLEIITSMIYANNEPWLYTEAVRAVASLRLRAAIPLLIQALDMKTAKEIKASIIIALQNITGISIITKKRWKQWLEDNCV